MEDWIVRFPLNGGDELRAEVRDALEHAGLVAHCELEGGHFPVLHVRIPDCRTLATLNLWLPSWEIDRCITRIPRGN